MNKTAQEIITGLQKALKEEVQFALVFGSITTENFSEKSDIDIGVYSKKPTQDEKMRLFKLIGDVTDREVDLIFLNDSDIIITMQILANGKLIVNNDPAFFNIFKAQKISQYPDFKLSRKIIEDHLTSRTPGFSKKRSIK
jgi:predicted nucleotidyltransferase